MFELKVDEPKLSLYVKSIVEEVLRGHGLLTAADPSLETGGREPENFFASSQMPEDLLRQLQAPDPDAGGRREPHWRLGDIHRDDRVFFRDAAARAVIGYGYAESTRRGPHPWNKGCPAVIVDIGGGVRFERPIADATFRDLFYKYGGNRRDFCLFQADGRYARKTYVYPLVRDLAAELMAVGASSVA
jgi:hypothetical protein